MPIYEYVCRDCDQEFELLIRGDDKPTCPSCGQPRLTRQLSVPAAHTGGTTDLPCAAREQGACDQSGCPSGGCGLGGPF